MGISLFELRVLPGEFPLEAFVPCPESLGRVGWPEDRGFVIGGGIADAIAGVVVGVFGIHGVKTCSDAVQNSVGDDKVSFAMAVKLK